MTDQNSDNRPLSEEELQDLVASSDAGARAPIGAVGTFMAIVAVVWSLFQVVLASPLANYILPGDIINNSRQIHLAFAIFLAFMAYPALKSSPRAEKQPTRLHPNPRLDHGDAGGIHRDVWFRLLSKDRRCRGLGG